MNPINMVPGVITRPARTAGAMAGATLGVGLRTTARVLGWAVERVVPSPEQSSPPMPEAPTPEAPTPEAPTAAKKSTSRTSTAKKAPVKKAPSKKAAVVAPALGLTEAEVEAELEPEPEPGSEAESGAGFEADVEVDAPTDEPLLDPGTAKAVASEAEVLQRAADPDKG